MSKTTQSTGWTEKEKLKLYEMFKEHGAQWSQFSKILKKNKETLRAMFNRTDWDDFFSKKNFNMDKLEKKIEKKVSEKIESSISDQAKELIEIRKERLCELGEKRKMNEHLNTIAKQELIYEKIISSIAQVPLIKSVYVKPKKHTDTSPQEAFMLLSDAHIGLAVVREEVGGLGEYNVPIFKRRVYTYLEKVLRITELHRTTHNIDTIHVCFMGDVVHGGNDAGKWGFLHSEQTVMDQVFNACSVFTEIFIQLSQVFKDVKIHCVFGNHGRIAKRGIEKKFVNWDYLIYKWIEGTMKAYKNVEFTIPRAAFQVAESLGNKFLLIHGDQARSWNSIPWYGLQRLESKYRSVLDGSKSIDRMWELIEENKIDPCSREASEFACRYMKSFDYMIMGHFHTMGEVETPSGGRIMMNSSFIGGDDYSIGDLVSCSIPAQKFFGINHHGKTWSYDIEIDR